MTKQTAIRRAKKLAKAGPRVSAVVYSPKEDEYGAAPGFMDADLPHFKQVLLVTPDGRVWEPASIHIAASEKP